VSVCSVALVSLATRELRAVGADVGHLVRDDQMMLGVDRDLHVVADNTGAAPARRHRAGIGIGKRDLLIGRSQHPRLELREAPHLLPQLGELLLQPRGLRGECL
jgi:hypothetical protein